VRKRKREVPEKGGKPRNCPFWSSWGEIPKYGPEERIIIAERSNGVRKNKREEGMRGGRHQKFGRRIEEVDSYLGGELKN